MAEPVQTKFSEASRVWRYVSLASFLHTPQEKGFYFPSLANLQKNDPYEGSGPERFTLAGWAMPTNMGPNGPVEGGRIEGTIMPRRSPRQAEATCVNCWHVADCESAAMWKLYSGDHGLAIQSTIGSLKSSFDPPVRVLPVNYLDDFEVTPSWRLDGGSDFFKRSSFGYEQEVRLVAENTAERGQSGLMVKADIQRLIERVQVSPESPEWLTQVIEREVKQHGLSCPVARSALYSKNLK